MKKNSCTPINPKQYPCYGLKKIHTRNLIAKKNPAARKFPSPHNFSNGPSLRCFISTVLLTDSCHDHAVIRDLSHYNPLVTLCLPVRDNTFRARVSLNSCLSFWVNFGIPSCLKSLLNRRQDSREVTMGKSKSREKPKYRSTLKISWGLAPSD